MKRALVVMVVLATGGVATWGCIVASAPATGRAVGLQVDEPNRDHDWQHYEPDGGWQAFRPAGQHVDYGPNPAQVMAGQREVSPLGLPGTDIH